MSTRPRLLALVAILGLLIPVVSPAAASATDHRVVPGETLSEIAHRYGVALAILADTNGIDDPHHVMAGQILAIPGSHSPSTGSHTVKVGESLSTIARRYGVDLGALADANGIPDLDYVFAGRILQVPGSARPGDSESGSRVRVVRVGDTLGAIAARSGVSSAGLAAHNGLADPDHLPVGLRLRIPAGESEPAGELEEFPESLRSHPERLALVPDFRMWAETYEVPLDLLMSLAHVESGWQAHPVSVAGAMGLAQLMPDTVELMRNVLLPGVDLDPWDPTDSVRMAARYLRYLRHRTGTWDDAVGAYFQGLAGLRRDGRQPATNDYIAAVNANRIHFPD